MSLNMIHLLQNNNLKNSRQSNLISRLRVLPEMTDVLFPVGTRYLIQISLFIIQRIKYGTYLDVKIMMKHCLNIVIIKGFWKRKGSFTFIWKYSWLRQNSSLIYFLNYENMNNLILIFDHAMLCNSSWNGLERWFVAGSNGIPFYMGQSFFDLRVFINLRYFEINKHNENIAKQRKYT